MAVPNPTQITSTLRMMSDPQLRQYAAMHKNDPYIFPMAFAESNARKQERSAQQAQSMGQPQGKVVDQAVAAMGPEQLPEQQGIGALPAPNMQRMADGGIAGYDDGNEFNYAGAEDSVVMGMAGGGVAHFADKGAVRGPYNDDTTMYDPATGQPITGDYTTGGTDDRTTLEKLGVFNPENRRANEKTEREMRARKNAGKGLDIPFDPGRGNSWDNEPVSAFDPGLGDSWDNKPTDKKKGTDKKKPAANVISPEEPAKAAAPAEKAPTGADLIAQAIAGSKALNDESAAAFKPYHDQLNKENEELLGRKADNRAYALLAAGLGMMGGTSQYAAQNIAAGGIKGLAVFQEAEKADAAARKANQQSQMLLMQAERAERSGNMKVAGDMQSRAEQARQFGITAEQKAEELKDTKEYHKGALANQRISANAAMLSAQRPLGGAYGMNESKFQLSALTRERDDIAKQLSSKENPMINTKQNAAEKAQLMARRNQLNAAIAQLSGVGTMDANSPSGSGGGQKVLDFNSIK